MDNDYLNFLLSFFSKLNVKSHIITIDTILSYDIDLGLRHTLTGDEGISIRDFDGIEQDFPYTNTIYLCCDKYECHYILIPSHDKDQHII